jgi:hypothetical protein
MELQFLNENLSKHGVTPEEVEECFCDPGRLLRRIGSIYWLVARTEAGRMLQIGFRKKPGGSYLVFHAMTAREYEQRQYKSRGK